MLFVDGDIDVLEGLHRAQRRQRKVWDMRSVVGGADAVRALDAVPFDVIVTALQMPEVDGLAVLAKARARQPGAIRIALTGDTRLSTGVRAAKLAHQVLSKPCSAESLRDTIRRATRLHGLLAQGSLKQLIGALESLPPLSDTAQKLNALVDDPDSSLADVARVVESDPSASAKVLQLVNSSFFGMGQSVTRISYAVAFLGLTLVRDVVLAEAAFSAFEDDQTRRLVAQVRDHSLQVAAVARALHEDPKEGEAAFAAGLLHDIGRLLLAMWFPERTRALLRGSDERPLIAMERDEFAVSHSDCGAYLLSMWGLPESLVQAAAWHHEPWKTAPDPVLAKVYLADRMVWVRVAPGSEPMNMEWLAQVGLTEQLDLLQARAESALSEEVAA